VTAILMLATFLALYARGGKPFGYNNLAYQLYLLVWAGTYFVWFWTKSGQTIGMLAWKIKLINPNGHLNMKQASKRYLLGFLGFWGLGLNYWWAFFDSKKQTPAEIYSGTLMIKVPKKPAA